jgi:hypothetical protein
MVIYVKYFDTLVKNIHKLFSFLPYRSPLRSTFCNILTQNLPTRLATYVVGVNWQTIRMNRKKRLHSFYLKKKKYQSRYTSEIQRMQDFIRAECAPKSGSSRTVRIRTDQNDWEVRSVFPQLISDQELYEKYEKGNYFIFSHNQQCLLETIQF